MGRRPRALIVDPEDGILDWISDILGAQGFEVRRAHTAERATAIAEEEEFTLAVCEVFLPGTNGIELVKRLKELTSAKVILIGRDAPARTIVAGMQAGADDFIEKPIDSERLRIAVDHALSRGRLERENIALKRLDGFRRQQAPDLVSDSRAMDEVLRTIELVAPTDLTVLIEGESGVGKELVANRLHQRSRRAGQPFVAINCGVIHENLLESELFGHEKGSFTGAFQEHRGIFEVADKGTLFLDEIGEMGTDLQVKLLRVLETGEFRRVGGHKTLRGDVRIVAATNRKLADEVRKGTFREDLFYRLNVIHIPVPPLRMRKEAVPTLVETFVERGRMRGLKSRRFSPKAMEVLVAYHWPGNVRELENLVERTLILAPNDVVEPADLPGFLTQSQAAVTAAPATEVEEEDVTLAEMERRHITRALLRHKNNKVRTAKRLGINVKTLYNKIKAYNIDEASIPRR